MNGVTLGVEVQSYNDSDWARASVRILRPFSWDAKERAFEIVDLELKAGEPVILVCGPYAAADAAAEAAPSICTRTSTMPASSLRLDTSTV